MNALGIILIISGAAYMFFLLWCLAGWKKLKNPDTGNKTAVFVTVIVPARNEAGNIAACLASLAEQDYPFYETIIADDDSSDTTVVLAEKFLSAHPSMRGSVMRLSNAGNTPSKKRAITCAADAANGEWIAVTDADCVVPATWLSELMKCRQAHDAVFIAGPVAFHKEQSLFDKMQSLEFMGLVGIGAGAFGQDEAIMCNGANMAYSKQAFRDCGGYSDDRLASGDDTTLLRRMKEKFPGQITFLKSQAALVHTTAAGSPLTLLHQRTRWASKIPTSMSNLARFAAFMALLFHAAIVASLLLRGSIVFAWMWLLKAIVEFVFLLSLAPFFKKRYMLPYFLPAQIIYPFYICLAGILSLRGIYAWKGRTVQVNKTRASF